MLMDLCAPRTRTGTGGGQLSVGGSTGKGGSVPMFRQPKEEDDHSE